MLILRYILPVIAIGITMIAVILTVRRRRVLRCRGNVPAGDIIPDMEAPLKALMEDEHLYTDSSISVDSVAKRLGTNRSYLSAFINERYGKSFSEYVNDYRTEAAMDLLKTDKELSLTEIAERCGYSSEATFYRNFKGKTGTTPGDYRNQS